MELFIFLALSPIIPTVSFKAGALLHKAFKNITTKRNTL